MTEANRRKFDIYKFMIIYIAIPITFGVIGLLVHNLYADVNGLKLNKVDKEVYCEGQKRIDEKLDSIRNMIETHERNSRQRYGR